MCQIFYYMHWFPIAFDVSVCMPMYDNRVQDTSCNFHAFYARHLWEFNCASLRRKHYLLAFAATTINNCLAFMVRCNCINTIFTL